MNNNPLLQSYFSRFIYTGSWILLTCMQAVLLYVYTRWSWMYIALDSVVFNSLYAVFAIALWYPVRFNRTALNGWLFIAFHLLLAILLLVCWLGVGFLLMNLCTLRDPDYRDFFLHSLPFRSITGMLIYVVTVLVYYLLIYVEELKKKVEIETPENSLVLSRIAVKRRQEIRVVPVHEITYLESDGDYVHLHTSDDRFLKEKTMKYWESHLPANLFVRIHRSYIINVEYLDRIEIYEKESYRVYLKNNICLKASSTGYKLLKQTVQL